MPCMDEFLGECRNEYHVIAKYIGVTCAAAGYVIMHDGTMHHYMYRTSSRTCVISWEFLQWQGSSLPSAAKQVGSP